MKAFLISGASGVLAREIIHQLLLNSPENRIIALSGSPEKVAQQYKDNPKVSVLDWNELDALDTSEDVIIHCAFARQEKGADLVTSLKNTERLLRIAAHFRTPFINISSRSVYGQNPVLPWTEDSELAPTNLYAIAKVAQELLVEQRGFDFAFPSTSLRLAGLVGVGMDARIVSKLVLQALQTEELHLVGGNQEFSFLDVRDAAAAIIALANMEPSQWENVYNLGHYEKVTLDEMAEQIKCVVSEMCRREISVYTEEKSILLLDGMDSSHFYERTGWRPSYMLRDTIGTLIETYGGKVK